MIDHQTVPGEKLSRPSLTSKRKRVPVTVSIGVTTALSGSFADMIELADQAVYRAKAASRNRVVDLSPDNAELTE
jgi:PleD family two-component response regulator